MENLKAVIQNRDFDTLIPLAGTDVFTADIIHETVKNEMAYIDFNNSFYHNEDSELLWSIIGNSVLFIEQLVNNKNVEMETLKALQKSTYEPLSDYALVKISIIKHSN